ncbi:hypothetical protein OG288_01410 [Streptomyces tauricus]|uniref:DUF304 domain-containing protein n=1 Tax=Streptomyces tauricus TaxID=68274 RepID=A0ABZ1JBB7_9ACTN|nr:hypothetical protein [Streptomyces tauricus]
MNGPAGPLATGSAGGAAPAFRLGVVQIAAPVLGGGLGGTVLAYVLVAAEGGRMTAGELWMWVSNAVLASVVVPALVPQYRVELSDSFLVLRGGGRRDIAWRDIIGIEVRKTAGVRTLVVYVSDGRRIPLRAPMSFLDSRFNDKAQVLMDWWTARRGDTDRV